MLPLQSTAALFVGSLACMAFAGLALGYTLLLRRQLAQAHLRTHSSNERSNQLESFIQGLQKQADQGAEGVKSLERRFERVTKSTGLGIWYCDLPFSELIWTPEVKDHFWLPHDARVTIEVFYERLHPEDQERTRKAIDEAIQNRTPYDIEYRTVLPGQENAYKWIRALGWTDYSEEGTPIRFDGVTLDVTEKKRIEDHLRAAVRSRDEFLVLASHELRTPLTSLKLQTQVASRRIERGAPDAYSEESVRKLVARTEKQVNRLSRLVEDMLAISSFRSEPMLLEPESFELVSLITEVAGKVLPHPSAGEIHRPVVLAKEPLWVRWDRMRIEQVLRNLLTNAIRYGRGEPVEIDVTNLAQSVRVTVRDRGIGIPREKQKKIFELFERAVDPNEVSGLGLGLYITRRIVDAHGGIIWVESEPGEGASFLFELPKRAGAAA